MIAFVSSYTIITDAEKSDVSGWKPKPPLANAAEGAFFYCAIEYRLLYKISGLCPACTLKNRVQPQRKSGGWINLIPQPKRAGGGMSLGFVLFHD